MFRAYFAVPDDVLPCVAMAPTVFGCSNESNVERYAGFLRERLSRGYTLMIVIKDEVNEPVAFGLSMFLSDEFRQELIHNYHNPVGQTVWLRGDYKKILPPRLILGAHRGWGLNLLGFYGWRSDLAHELLQSVKQLLWASFPLLHRGYYLKSFLKEVYGEEERAFYEQVGLTVYKTPDRYNFLYREHRPYLVGTERDRVQFPQMAAEMFLTEPPRLALSERHRAIGQLAYILRLDSAQIADCLSVKVNTIYTHWHRMCVYVRGSCDESCRRAGRRVALSYIAAHPQEIYPLSIHTMFYCRPELARRYPLPLMQDWQTALVTPLPAERVALPNCPSPG